MIGFEFNMESMASFQDQLLQTIEPSLRDLKESDFIQKIKQLKESAPAVLAEIPIDRFCDISQQDGAVCDAAKQVLGLEAYTTYLQVPELENVNQYHDPSGVFVLQKGRTQKEYDAIIKHPHSDSKDKYVEARCVQTQSHNLIMDRGQLLHSSFTYTNCETSMEYTDNLSRAQYTTHTDEKYLATAIEQDGVYYDVFPLTYSSQNSHSVYYPDLPEPPLYDGWML